VKTDLLVAPVSLVDWIEEDMQREGQPRVAPDTFTQLERPVGRGIVDHEDLNIALVRKSPGNAREHGLDRALGVIRHDEDQQPPTATGCGGTAAGGLFDPHLPCLA
jgi:hypothetical protein